MNNIFKSQNKNIENFSGEKVHALFEFALNYQANKQTHPYEVRVVEVIVTEYIEPFQMDLVVLVFLQLIKIHILVKMDLEIMLELIEIFKK